MGFRDSQSPPGFGTSSCNDVITISASSNQGSDSNAVRINTLNNIFYKTRECLNYKKGFCSNGEMCKYAHGPQDRRQPPHNWQELYNRSRGSEGGNLDDEQRIALKMKLCKRFSNGEVCPYGDKCNFLHDDSKRYRDDSARVRDGSVVGVGVSLNNASGHGHGLDQTDVNFVNVGPDAYRMNVRTEHWKTKLCCKFEQNGFCAFGDKCGFAHGIAELKVYAGRAEGEITSVGYLATPMKPVVGVPTHLVSNAMYNAVPNEEQLVKKDFSLLKGTKKINRIYGDWIDDVSLDPPLP